MKNSIISLILLFSTASYAGGGSGGGPIDTTVISCFKILPLQEGEGTAGLHLTENGLRVGFSNHVNDFNVSFEPVKVITRIQDAAEVVKQDHLLAFKAVNEDLTITVDAVEILASLGPVVGQIEVNGQSLQGSCTVYIHNLKAALK